MIPILLVGRPEWAETLHQTLGAAYSLHQIENLQGYMNRIIELRPALIIVDGKLENWDSWLTIPKVSPATRRIPILLITDAANQRADAALYGADFALSADELLKNPLQILTEYARIPDAAFIEQLDCDCQEALPELAQEGIRQFNLGEYYRQHDLFEEQWMATTSPVRDLYRAILQVGIGYYQIERGNYRGALKMLQRSVQWLMLLPDVCQGVNIRQLRDDSFRVRAELERLGEDGFSEFDKALIKKVEMVE